MCGGKEITIKNIKILKDMLNPGTGKTTMKFSEISLNECSKTVLYCENGSSASRSI